MGRETTRTSDRMRPSRRTRLCLPAVFAELLAVAPVAARTGTVLVERVIDGDTIRVRMAGAPYTVRLTGVDAPETKHPTLGIRRLVPSSPWQKGLLGGCARPAQAICGDGEQVGVRHLVGQRDPDAACGDTDMGADL